MNHPKKQVAVLHGAGYVGGELIRLLLAHPYAELQAVTSTTFAGEPVWKAHATLQGQTNILFSEETSLSFDDIDVLFVAGEHGGSAQTIPALIRDGFDGSIIDLSADFRLSDPSYYKTWFDYAHPAPDLLSSFVYGLPECLATYKSKSRGVYPVGSRFIANPGCFATGMALALGPIAQAVPRAKAFVTALTGASGSGARPQPATHYPSRAGNVRAYKTLAHQHVPEVSAVVGSHVELAFTPASGPWSRGIWGAVYVTLPSPFEASDAGQWFSSAYESAPLVRVREGELPELLPVVNTPFCDIGWVVRDDQLVVGFALDNLIKGAAGQAIQNMNLLFGLPETAGLLPDMPPADN